MCFFRNFAIAGSVPATLACSTVSCVDTAAYSRAGRGSLVRVQLHSEGASDGIAHSLVLYDSQETAEEVKAAAGFLAGFSDRTREAYTLDLRQFIIWCGQHHLGLFDPHPHKPFDLLP